MARVALVTGGNRGIGFEAWRRLAASGMKVVLTARNEEKGEEAAKSLRDEGLDVVYEQLDVADGGSVTACARRLSGSGTNVDVLVNNAGVYPTEGVLSVSEETFRRAIEIDAIGPLLTCRTFVPGMVERGYGRVVNVSFGEGLRAPSRRRRSTP